MSEDFAPVASALRDAVLDWYASHDQHLEGAAGENTLETNSGWVERRTEPLLEMLRERGGPSLEGLRVADLGCGFGAMSVFLGSRGASVVGLDPNEDRLDVGRTVAAKFGFDVRFERAPMQTLAALDDAGFDLAVQNNSLCYIVPREERILALRETRRILRPSGWMITRNPNRWHPLDLFTKLPLLPMLPPRRAMITARRLGRRRAMVRLVSPPTMARELRAAGFTDVAHCTSSNGSADALKLVARYQHFVARRP